MKGDFTRDTFDRSRRYSRVLMQQGRVQLDADWNEQGSIFADSIRQLAADLIGPHGGPAGASGLRVTRKSTNDPVMIEPGRYYVGGLPCELLEETAYTDQPYRPRLEHDIANDPLTIVYLEVWEQHVTYALDPLLREVALGGPDTATRAQIVWQARSASSKDQDLEKDERWKTLNEKLTAAGNAPSDATIADLGTLSLMILAGRAGRSSLPTLKAQARQTEQDDDPCLAAPEARFRGEENQLYRVEIHDPGSTATATFKWDAENGSRIFQIRHVATGEDTWSVELASLGRDARTSLTAGDWVELTDDGYDQESKPGILAKVKSVSPASREVVLALRDEDKKRQIDLSAHALLRKWDGAHIKVFEVSDGSKSWIDLDKGVQIQFSMPPKGAAVPAAPAPARYRTGDYWLIPARVLTGDVEWPQKDGAAVFLPPRGIERYFAPIALIPQDKEPVDIRREFRPLVDQRK